MLPRLYDPALAHSRLRGRQSVLIVDCGHYSTADTEAVERIISAAATIVKLFLCRETQARPVSGDGVTAVCR